MKIKRKRKEKLTEKEKMSAVGMEKKKYVRDGLKVCDSNEKQYPLYVIMEH